MSSRAHMSTDDVRPFNWGSRAAPADVLPDDIDLQVDQLPMPAPAGVIDQQHFEQIEQHAFARGYEQGERAGADAATAAAGQAVASAGQGLLRRLADTIEQLSETRQDLIRRTERQLVELSLAIARQVLRREISLDRSLLVAMARVALDRLGETKAATIRLHPDDYAELNAGAAASAGPTVSIVADPAVERGGCLVECDAGWMSVGLDSQYSELTRTLLGD
jgi:flagellar assembly protein FliH